MEFSICESIQGGTYQLLHLDYGNSSPLSALPAIAVHATDVHYCLDRVDQLKGWLKEHRQKLDVVLVSGDIANGPMDWSLSEGEIEEYRQNLETVLQSFTNIHDKVYYIPGNVSKTSDRAVIPSV